MWLCLSHSLLHFQHVGKPTHKFLCRSASLTLFCIRRRKDLSSLLLNMYTWLFKKQANKQTKKQQSQKSQDGSRAPPYISAEWMNKWVEEFIFQVFLWRWWRIYTVNGSTLYPLEGAEFKIVEEEEAVAVEATNVTDDSPRPTAFTAFQPNCALRNSWYKAPYTLTHKQHEGSEPQSGLIRRIFFSYQRGRKDHYCPMDQLFWPTNNVKGIKRGSAPHSPPGTV